MHIPFFSISQFHNVFARQTWDGVERGTLTFGAKIKLHGANAGIRIDPNGTVTPQGRHNDLVAGDKGTDPYRFAEFVNDSAHIWADMAGAEPVVVYGEWAGAGVAKGDAIHLIETKRFYIAAIGFGEAPAFWTVNEPEDRQKIASAAFTFDPDVIALMLPKGIDEDRVRVLPYEDTFTFNFADEAQVAAELERLNATVDAIAVRDPFVHRSFGVDKGGEGLVLTPLGGTPWGQEPIGRTAFKAKVEKHRVQKQPAPAVARDPLPADVAAFVDTYCTEPRMAQAIVEICADTPDIRQMNAVMGWLIADIFKEGREAFDALGVEEKIVDAHIRAVARPVLVALLKR